MDDVDAALHYLESAGHRDDHYLPEDRKAKCFQATGKPEDACRHFKKALDAAAASSTIPDMMKSAFEKQVKANMEKLGKVERGDDDVDPMRAMYDISLPKKHAKHSSMSGKLAINYSSDRGRCVFHLLNHLNIIPLKTLWYISGTSLLQRTYQLAS